MDPEVFKGKREGHCFDIDAVRQSEKEFYEEGKKEINNLLWQYLPPWIVLDKAEELACVIHRLIRHEWEKDPIPKKGNS